MTNTIAPVRIRQLADRIRHQLSFVPGLYVMGAIITSQLLLIVDRSLSDQAIPQFFITTVDSARSLFTAIAGGLITSITLLLSMILVAIQLASSQFSPRTLREWLSDRLLQNTVGLALGTTVFCLLALRSTRAFGDEGGAIVPHTSAIVAVVLGVAALFAVVRTVDHITHSLRIGTIASRVAADTIEVIRQQGDVMAEQHATSDPTGVATAPAAGDRPDDELDDVSADAFAVEAPRSGWVQQIDLDAVLTALPDDTRATIVVPLGGYVNDKMPLMWLDPPPPVESGECVEDLRRAFAFGNSRTLQADIGFGLMQLTDIAVRALSPGINDPGTANDVIVHLGDVLIELWTQPHYDREIQRDGKSVVNRRPSREEHLRRSVGPIRRYGASDPFVMASLTRTLITLASEVQRRGLPGPVAPIRDMISTIESTVDTASWSQAEVDELTSLISSSS